MKTTTSLFVLGTVAILFVFFSGCYTQLSTTREEPPAGEGYGYGQPEDTVYSSTGDTTQGYAYDNNNGYYNNGYDDEYSHPSVGFSYYYPSYYWPSYGFALAYSDPWAWASFGWSYPWYCGTPYLSYPWYGYYPHGYYYGYHQYGYAYGGRGTNFTGRAFGSTRSSSGGRQVGDTRTGVYTPTSSGSGYDLPRAARVANPLAGPPATSRSTNVNKGRATGVQRTPTSPRSNVARVPNTSRYPVRRYYRLPSGPTYRAPATVNGRSSDHSRPAQTFSPAPQRNAAPHVSGGTPSGGRSGGGGGRSGGGGGGGRGGRR